MSTDDLLLPDPPDVPGLRFRHFQAPDDFAGMAAANQATRDAAGQEEVITAESMARDYAHFINWDPVADTIIAERAGRIVWVAGHGGLFDAKHQMIKADFDALWAEGFDALVAPTSPTVAFRFGARMADPVAMYLSDIYTVSANLAGVPSIIYGLLGLAIGSLVGASPAPATPSPVQRS